ncbi:MAG: hypothetical protein R3B68_04575 [Phycisphaerales bacterium]
MSQFGMQMPGGRARRGSSPDVYTGLLFLAVAALAAACVVLYMAGSKVGPEGNALGMHEAGSPVNLATQGR